MHGILIPKVTSPGEGGRAARAHICRHHPFLARGVASEATGQARYVWCARCIPSMVCNVRGALFSFQASPSGEQLARRLHIRLDPFGARPAPPDSASEAASEAASEEASEARRNPPRFRRLRAVFFSAGCLETNPR
eukprot:gene324-biopygen12103